MTRKKTYILDTSVYLTDFNAIYAFKNNDIVIPMKVLEEIDGHKKRQDSVGLNARMIIKIFDDLRSVGSLQKGVKIKKGLGTIMVKGFDPEVLPNELSVSDSDNQIIATALTELKLDSSKKVAVVSRDINMRVKCDALGIPAEDYFSGKIINNAHEIYTGYKEILVDDADIDRFYDGEPIRIDDEKHNVEPNQFLMLISNTNNKKTALARYMGKLAPLKKVVSDYPSSIWGLTPRNKEQCFAMDLLLDKSIPIVSLIGKAGSGKTLCALAAGLHQVLDPKSDAFFPISTKKSKYSSSSEKKGKDEQTYKRLIVSRPVQPLGKDIGFLPGSLEEKMAPWLKPVQDNLQFLLGDDKTTLEMYMETGVIEIEALTYIRGRSISNAYIIIDESQNLTKHELKTIITRVGEGTKIVLTGDIEQIDNIYLDETTNGLTYAVEKFKPFNITGHITLMKGERSEVATLAAKIL